ncbi:MAG: hypothetical protein H7343_23160 [Undibacterium sp.]|nr:hypothetical protein [Opitutaceae bacterium]
MYFYLVAFGLLAHVIFWGAGLALLVMPGRWRNFWTVLVVPAGFTLQALVVWLGSNAGLRGTHTYAWASEVVPVVLLLGAGWWRGQGALWAGVKKFWPVWSATAVTLAVLVLPLARASKGLTPTSLGSCDAADYAAGARVLMEFAQGDRQGFLGLTEVVRVMSADNFFDYWTRLNHFTPAALIALNGTILDCGPYELTSLMTMVLLAGSLPMVFWTARAVLRYEGRASWAIAALYGVSPITWYAVAHVAMGQLLAAHAIMLLTWAGVALWRGRMQGRRVWQFSGVLLVGYALVLSSYNFILLVCVAPAVAYAGGLAAWTVQWGRLGRWTLAMAAPLIVAGLIFWERVAGLAERLALLQQYDFGWKIPMLAPAGWLGMVANTGLSPWPTWARAGLAVPVVGLLVSALVRGAKLRRSSAFVALCLSLPPLLGYGYLNLRGVWLGTNASYDAYKILAVFYPGLLAALVYWVTLDRQGWRRGLVVTCGVAVAAMNLVVAYRFTERLEHPPLIVGRELLQLQKLEARSDIGSLNIRIPDMWSRLWANSFLLKKPQYFETHTYEGRLNTPLRGAWDLNGGLVGVLLPDGGSERVNAHYALVNTTSRYFLRVSLGDGWHDLERLSRTATRWNWTKGDATLRIDNPQERPLRVVCRFNVRSETDRDLQLWLNGRRLRTVKIGTELKVVRVPEIMVPAGMSVLELRSSTPPTRLGGGDARPLGFAMYGIELEVKSEMDETEN